MITTMPTLLTNLVRVREGSGTTIFWIITESWPHRVTCEVDWSRPREDLRGITSALLQDVRRRYDVMHIYRPAAQASLPE